jgi:hypothetical protein
MSREAQPQQSPIISGKRSPADRQQTTNSTTQDQVEDAVRVASAPRNPRNDGSVLFVSRDRSYRLQLVAIGDKVDPATGRILKGETKTAVFQNKEFRTSDPEVIAWVRAAKGFNVEFWDASELEAASRQQAEDSLVNTLTQDPALLDRVMERMTANANPQPRQEVTGGMPPPQLPAGAKKE